MTWVRSVLGDDALENYQTEADGLTLRRSLSQAVPQAEQQYQDALTSQTQSILGAIQQASTQAQSDYESGLEQHASSLLSNIDQADQAARYEMQGMQAPGTSAAPTPEFQAYQQSAQSSIQPSRGVMGELAGQIAQDPIGAIRDWNLAAVEQDTAAQHAKTAALLQPAASRFGMTPEETQQLASEAQTMAMGAEQVGPATAENIASLVPRVTGAVEQAAGIPPGPPRLPPPPGGAPPPGAAPVPPPPPPEDFVNAASRRVGDPEALRRFEEMDKQPGRKFPAPGEMWTRFKERFDDEFDRLRQLGDQVANQGVIEPEAKLLPKSAGTAQALRSEPGMPPAGATLEGGARPNLTAAREAIQTIPSAPLGPRAQVEVPYTDAEWKLAQMAAQEGKPSAYNLAIRYAGTKGEADAILETELAPILQGVIKDGNDLKSLNTLLRIRQTPELIRNGFKTPGGMTVNDAENAALALRDRLGPERLQKLIQRADDIYTFINKNQLDIQEGSLLSADAIARVKAANQYYFPHLVQDLADSQFADIPTGGRFNVSASDVMRRKGSERAITDPLKAIVARQYSRLDRVRRNEVAQQMVSELKQAFPDIVRDRPDGYTPVDGEGVVNFMQDGVKQSVIVPQEYAWVANRLDRGQMHPALRIVSNLNNLSRTGYTSLNPNFILRNMLRDPMEAFYREGMIPFGYHHIRGILSGLLHDADWEAYMRARAGISGLFEGGAGYETAKRLSQTPMQRIVSDARNPIEILRKANEIIEEGTRIGVFTQRTGLRQGPSLPGPLSGLIGEKPVGLAQGTVASRQSTIDFGNGGSWTKALNPFVLFLNANEQGFSKMVEPLGRGPAGAARASLRLAIMATAAAAAYFHNRLFNYEDGRSVYQDIPQYERDNNFVFLYGTGRDQQGREIPAYMRIPKPQAVKVAWNAIEQGLEWQQEHAKDEPTQRDLAQLSKDLIGVVSPIPIEGASILPPAVSIPLELKSNYKFYQGQPIESDIETEQPAQMRVRPYTTQTAQALSGMLQHFQGMPIMGWFADRSPIQLDYLVQAWLGGGGVAVMQAADQLGRATGMYPPLEQTQESPEYRLGQTPVVAGIVAARGGQYREQGRRKVEKQQQATIQEALSRMDTTGQSLADQAQGRARVTSRIVSRFARARRAAAQR